MTRTDLAAVTDEDLEAYSNRGTLRRAAKEVEAGTHRCEWSEADEGTVTAVWSDGVTCTLPGAGTIADGTCTCAAAQATACRHLVRTVLAYRRKVAECSAGATQSGPWDPGMITDQQLAEQFPKAVLTAARRELEAGLLVELTRSERPLAVIHGLGVTVRFAVPGDPRYARADVEGRAAERAVCMAVWAFRLLEPARDAGYVVTGTPPQRPQPALGTGGEELLRELLEYGLAAASNLHLAQLRRLEGDLRAASLVWPAEVIAELSEEIERYTTHDALFSPEHCVDLIGEWLARIDALSAATGAVPSLLVAGTRHDVPRSLTRRRLVGLGCGVSLRRKRADLRVYLQDQESGMVSVVERSFADPSDPAQAPRSFSSLAQTPAVKGASLHDLAAGQVLLATGRCTPSGRLTPGLKAAVNPQACAWEHLREPVRVESYGELEARLAGLPPVVLRPLSAGESFHVLPVAGVAAARFDAARQEVQAVLTGPQGGKVHLRHPYTSRGAAGTEALLEALTGDARACFAAGTVRPAARGLMLAPVAVVIEEGSGRRMVQPWVQAAAPGSEAATGRGETGAGLDGGAVRQLLEELQEAMAELLLVGVRRCDPVVVRRWQQAATQAEALGLTRLADLVALAARGLRARQHQIGWQAGETLAAVLELMVSVRIAGGLLLQA